MSLATPEKVVPLGATYQSGSVLVNQPLEFLESARNSKVSRFVLQTRYQGTHDKRQALWTKFYDWQNLSKPLALVPDWISANWICCQGKLGKILVKSFPPA